MWSCLVPRCVRGCPGCVAHSSSERDAAARQVDHLVKYTSSQTEPAWTQSQVGKAAGLLVWRIEDFQVIAWPKSKYGTFHEGDSYIVLHSYQVGKEDKLRRGWG